MVDRLPVMDLNERASGRDGASRGAANGRPDGAAGPTADAQPRDRADRVAERIAIPVLIAALASVPAVFLTLLDEPYETVGQGLNMVSGGVLVAETLVLFLVSDDRLAWLKRNKWLVALAVVIVPAVIFAIGPVQLLRVLYLVRFIGALRIIRVGRILKAGRIVRERYGLDKRWQRAITVAVTLLCAAFVGVVLADPDSQSRMFLEGAVDQLGWVGIVIAGLILAAATYLVYTQKQRDQASEE